VIRPAACSHPSCSRASAAIRRLKDIQIPTPEFLDVTRRRAENGDPDAQCLGIFYSFGRDVARDPVLAAKWYRLAVDQGDAQARYTLGIAYD
jgi:TPR repeat protein